MICKNHPNLFLKEPSIIFLKKIPSTSLSLPAPPDVPPFLSTRKGENVRGSNHADENAEPQVKTDQNNLLK